ncbi:MAG: IS4 family transposase [Kofleriaceae bacterium]|nr:IS4 family transposase [Kofleriaceae bacterium]
MGWDLALAAAATYANPEQFETFRRHIDAEWIEQALAATGKATVRRRRLPVEEVVWIVLGMALFRDRPIEDVVSKLDLALPGSGTVARSSVSQARGRLGSEPMKWLFEQTGSTWAQASACAHRWRGLALYGIDGSSLRVPDTPENREHFGGQSGRKGTESGYPMVRVVALMVLRSHLLAGAWFGPYGGTNELEPARQLVTAIPDLSLTVVDRGFLAAPMLLGVELGGQERHWLTRAKSNSKWRVLARLGKGDELVEMDVSREARRKDPSLPRTWTMRAIRYQRKGFRPQTLLTSLRDAKQYPAGEVIALYHERWELELGYDELKTELLDREEAIRSKKRDGVEQELWGILLAYNLVRLEMERVAKQAKVEPTRISFVESLRLIRDEWAWLSVTSPGAIPKRLASMRANIKRYVLPPRRPSRLYPRAVKIKMSNYPRKRPRVET